MIHAKQAIGLGVMLLLLPAARTPEATATQLLQARADRILLAAGQDVTFPVVISPDQDLPSITQTGPLAIPKALIAMAPTSEALDGLLAMLLSFRAGTKNPDRASELGSTLAAAGLIAATGGATDAVEGKNHKTIPLGTFPRDRAQRVDKKGLAQRGVRWNTLAGNCTRAQVAFLRLIGSPRVSSASRATSWEGSAFAREVVRDMGMEAYPRQETCNSEKNTDFDALKSRIES